MSLVQGASLGMTRPAIVGAGQADEASLLHGFF